MDWMRWIRSQWDRCGAWACILAGVGALVAGWIGVSSTAYPAEQLPYILSGGVAGIFLLGLGAMLWLSADLRDEWNKLDRIEQAVRDGQQLAGAVEAESRPNGASQSRPKASRR
jgi:hypothetical protein